MTTTTRLAAMIAAGALVVAACGGDDDTAPDTTTAAESDDDDDDGDGDAGSDDGTPPATTNPDTTPPDTTTTITTTTTVPDEPVAAAVLIDDNVDVRFITASDFAPVGDQVDVAVGDTVRTDHTGFAEIAYFDGSLARLDINTELEVLALVDDPGSSQIRTRMGLGRTWHRVETLTGDDTYTVETSVAVATVRGTAFTITCLSDTVCRFDVADGTIELELADGTAIILEAPAGIEIDLDTDDHGDPVPLTFDAMFGDPWVFDNGLRDTDAGYAGPGDLYAIHGPHFASINGTFTGLLTTTEYTCNGPGCDGEDFEDFEVVEEILPTYAFGIDCDSVPCTGVALTDIEVGGELVDESVPLVFDGMTYTWSFEGSDANCWYVNDDGTRGEEFGERDWSIAYAVSADAGEVRDDRWVITAASGTAEFVQVASPAPDGECAEFVRDEHEQFAMELTRG